MVGEMASTIAKSLGIPTTWKRKLCGDVEMWNVVGGYGFVRDDESKKTIFFHATHKHQDTWMPMRGDAVQYRIGFDQQKNRLSAFDIGLRHTVAPNDFAVDSKFPPRNTLISPPLT